MKCALMALFLALIATTATAGDRSSSCSEITGAAEHADQNYAVAEIRRNATGITASQIFIEVRMLGDAARKSRQSDPQRIEKIWACKDEESKDTVRFQVHVALIGGLHVASVPLPKDLTNARVRSCGGNPGRCWSAVFKGDFTSPLVLMPE